jgi:TfoX/Sxy family transcriptional regulator of competence genes
VAYDPHLAERLRDLLAAEQTAVTQQTVVTEKVMFGGLAFLVGGNMCCGVVGDELVARVGRNAAADALEQPGARPMDFTGRPMAGWVMVGPDGTGNDDSLAAWVRRALAFVEQLPAK